MPTNIATANDLEKREAKYLTAIGDALAEMAERRKRMKEIDREIDLLRLENRRQMKEIWSLLHRVQGTL
jgi:hypothetical protein